MIVQRVWPYIELVRLNRPIGLYLLLWPTLIGLWFASKGVPLPGLLTVFVLGVVLTRSAGCALNDLADYRLDAQVHRTRQRPLVLQAITPIQALIVAVFLLMLAFGLVLFTNAKTLLMAWVAVILVVIYPLMKRYTYLPQLVLGAAFACSIPMAYTAQGVALNAEMALLYLATLLWTVAYDTQYAMVDRKDDLKAGIKSTAILLGAWDREMIALLQMGALVSWGLAGVKAQIHGIFYLGLLLAAGTFVYQYQLTASRQPQQCFRAFLNNHWSGVLVFAGTGLAWLLAG